MPVSEGLVGGVDGLLPGELLQNVVMVGLAKLVAVTHHGFGPDHVVQDEDALHAGVEGLALKPAGVGDDLLRILRQVHGVGVAHRLGKDHIFEALVAADPVRALMVTGMDRVDRGRIQAVGRQQDLRQWLVAVGVLLPMAGHVVKLRGNLHGVACKIKDVRMVPGLIRKM